MVGWKEYELEVMRDHADNVVVICSIENFDPMGVHTGDSITVAPSQTLTDVDYQRMRDAAFACIRRIGVDTGGSNVQFAVNPVDGEMVIIEMNPRVSRSSALGEQGDRVPDREDRREARGRLPARRGHQRHHRRHARELRADDRLRRHEDPALGVREAAGRVAGAEHDDAVGRRGDGDRPHVPRVAAEVPALARDRVIRVSPRTSRASASRAPRWPGIDTEELVRRSAVPTPERIFLVAAALDRGISVERLHEITGIDPWFLDQMQQIIEEQAPAAGARLDRRAHQGGLEAGQAARVR